MHSPSLEDTVSGSFLSEMQEAIGDRLPTSSLPILYFARTRDAERANLAGDTHTADIHRDWAAEIGSALAGFGVEGSIIPVTEAQAHVYGESVVARIFAETRTHDVTAPPSFLYEMEKEFGRLSAPALRILHLARTRDAERARVAGERHTARTHRNWAEEIDERYRQVSGRNKLVPLTEGEYHVYGELIVARLFAEAQVHGGATPRSFLRAMEEESGGRLTTLVLPILYFARMRDAERAELAGDTHIAEIHHRWVEEIGSELEDNRGIMRPSVPDSEGEYHVYGELMVARIFAANNG